MYRIMWYVVEFYGGKMKPKVKLLFEVDLAFGEQFSQEAKKLKIAKIELLRRMWKSWKQPKEKKY